MIGLALFIIWLVIALISYIKNRDLLSPSKFYLLYIGIYFAAIFYKDYNEKIYITYLILLLLGLYFVISEHSVTKYMIKHEQISSRIKSNIKFDKAINMIWILSIVPIFAQLYIIQYMGGIQNYINKIGLRVVEWQGLGIVLEAIKLFSILNIVYFALLLFEKKIRKISFIKYLIHLSIFLVIGFLSGSRGGMLGNFVLMVVLYNYTKQKLKIRSVLPIIMSLLLIASIVGVARNNYKLTDEGFVSGLSTSAGNILESKHFEYGIVPLELVYSIENNDLKYGFTFLTPITNLVPRSIWSEKPDTGGVVFTKIYTDNAWDGYSNLAPGIIGEGVINFGKPFGIVVGIVLLAGVIRATSYMYRRILYSIYSDRITLKMIFKLIFYTFVVTTVPGLVQSEWTNTVLSLFLRGVKLVMIYFILKINMKTTIFKKKKIVLFKKTYN